MTVVPVFLTLFVALKSCTFLFTKFWFVYFCISAGQWTQPHNLRFAEPLNSQIGGERAPELIYDDIETAVNHILNSDTQLKRPRPQSSGSYRQGLNSIHISCHFYLLNCFNKSNMLNKFGPSKVKPAPSYLGKPLTN